MEGESLYTGHQASKTYSIEQGSRSPASELALAIRSQTSATQPPAGFPNVPIGTAPIHRSRAVKSPSFELVKHQLDSTGRLRAFSCPLEFCQRPFRRLEHLKRHVRTHTRERPYPCAQCGRSFSRQDNLLQHIRIHYRAGSTDTIKHMQAVSTGLSVRKYMAPTYSACECPHLHEGGCDSSLRYDDEPQPDVSASGRSGAGAMSRPIRLYTAPPDLDVCGK